MLNVVGYALLSDSDLLARLATLGIFFYTPFSIWRPKFMANFKNVIVIVGYGRVVYLNAGFRGQGIRFLRFQMCKTQFSVFFSKWRPFLANLVT